MSKYTKVLFPKDVSKQIYYELTPYRLAILDLIAYTEGTDRELGKDKKGYDILFGYKKFNPNSKDHPRKVIRAGGYASTAAGRYQILDKTYDLMQRHLVRTGFKPFPSFKPEYQDQMGMYLIDWKRGALNFVDTGNLAGFCNACSYEWASIPPGRYGQPVVDYKKCREIYYHLLGLWAA